jgi:hypothetical protein
MLLSFHLSLTSRKDGSCPLLPSLHDDLLSGLNKRGGSLKDAIATLHIHNYTHESPEQDRLFIASLHLRKAITLVQQLFVVSTAHRY